METQQAELLGEMGVTPRTGRGERRKNHGELFVLQVV